MAFPWATAIMAGGSLIGHLAGRRRRPDIGSIIGRFRSERPVGYLTPEDYAFAERQRGSATASAARSAEMARALGIRRAIGTGTLRSPATGRAMRAIDLEEASERERAFGGAQDLLYRTRQGRERFEQEKAFRAFGAALGQAQREEDQIAGRDAAFWGSWIPLLGELGGAFGGGGKGGSGLPTKALEQASRFGPEDLEIRPRMRRLY